jgi:tetratricopeptide (TPR) repeat protein
MTLNERRWQEKLARKRKAQANRKPSPPRSGPPSPAQAAQRPIHDSLIAKGLFEEGIGLVGLARALPDGDVALAAFLVDVYCLGVKNAFYRVVSPAEWAEFLERSELEKIHPSCLRKLVEGAVAYARDLGLPPHADYARAAQLFGTIEAAACPVRYTYGHNGKPFYVSGPNDSPAQSKRMVNMLTRRLGANGFHFMTATDIPAAAATTADQNADRVAAWSYEITRDPIPEPEFEQLPDEVQARINELHDEIQQAKPRRAVPALRALIEQHPDVPTPYNFLYVAHCKLGEHAEATRVLQQTRERFPDYLFGHISLANECLMRGETEKVDEIFGGKFDLKLLYPDRVRFHITEALAFQAIVARYYHALGDREQAQRYYDLMRQIDPASPMTRDVERRLHSSRLGTWLRNSLRRR